MSSVTPIRLALALALLVCSSAVAQQQGRGRGQGGPGGGFGGPQIPGQEKLQLVANEAVQKELELADDQKSDLKKIAEDAQTKIRALFGDAFRGGQDLSDDERAKRREEMQKKGETIGKDVLTKVAAVLLPHQADRLQEIYVQVRGPSVLTDDAEISKQLAVTDDQKEKLQEIRRQAFQGLGGGQGGQGGARPQPGQGGQGGARPQGGGQGGFQIDPERLAAMRKDREEKSLAVLTTTQKDQYTKMKGEPFAGAASIVLGRGGFGGGGQPGQGGRPGQGGDQGGQPRTRPGGNNNNNTNN